ncbi:MAG: DUF4190 domain-containing protein [Pyrinomonadaceae bacterium]
MSSIKKVCHECGMPLTLGVAVCESCGTQVGTVFSETAPPIPPKKKAARRKATDAEDHYGQIDQAQQRANNSLILALASFFCPLIGLIMCVAAIVMSALALRTLRRNFVEDGRGSATAGLIIGVIALIAQIGYMVYMAKSGKIPFV